MSVIHRNQFKDSSKPSRRSGGGGETRPLSVLRGNTTGGGGGARSDKDRMIDELKRQLRVGEWPGGRS